MSSANVALPSTSTCSAPTSPPTITASLRMFRKNSGLQSQDLTVTAAKDRLSPELEPELPPQSVLQVQEAISSIGLSPPEYRAEALKQVREAVSRTRASPEPIYEASKVWIPPSNDTVLVSRHQVKEAIKSAENVALPKQPASLSPQVKESFTGANIKEAFNSQKASVNQVMEALGLTEDVQSGSEGEGESSELSPNKVAKMKGRRGRPKKLVEHSPKFNTNLSNPNPTTKNKLQEDAKPQPDRKRGRPMKRDSSIPADDNETPDVPDRDHIKAVEVQSANPRKKLGRPRKSDHLAEDVDQTADTESDSDVLKKDEDTRGPKKKLGRPRGPQSEPDNVIADQTEVEEHISPQEVESSPKKKLGRPRKRPRESDPHQPDDQVCVAPIVTDEDVKTNEDNAEASKDVVQDESQVEACGHPAPRKKRGRPCKSGPGTAVQTEDSGQEDQAELAENHQLSPGGNDPPPAEKNFDKIAKSDEDDHRTGDFTEESTPVVEEPGDNQDESTGSRRKSTRQRRSTKNSFDIYDFIAPVGRKSGARSRKNAQLAEGKDSQVEEALRLSTDDVTSTNPHCSDKTVASDDVTSKDAPSNDVTSKNAQVDDVTAKSAITDDVITYNSPSDVTEKSSPSDNVIINTFPCDDVSEKSSPPDDVTEKSSASNDFTANDVTVKKKFERGKKFESTIETLVELDEDSKNKPLGDEIHPGVTPGENSEVSTRKAVRPRKKVDYDESFLEKFIDFDDDSLDSFDEPVKKKSVKNNKTEVETLVEVPAVKRKNGRPKKSATGHEGAELKEESQAAQAADERDVDPVKEEHSTSRKKIGRPKKNKRSEEVEEVHQDHAETKVKQEGETVDEVPARGKKLGRPRKSDLLQKHRDQSAGIVTEAKVDKCEEDQGTETLSEKKRNENISANILEKHSDNQDSEEIRGSSTKDDQSLKNDGNGNAIEPVSEFDKLIEGLPDTDAEPTISAKNKVCKQKRTKKLPEEPDFPEKREKSYDLTGPEVHVEADVHGDDVFDFKTDDSEEEFSPREKYFRDKLKLTLHRPRQKSSSFNDASPHVATKSARERFFSEDFNNGHANGDESVTDDEDIPLLKHRRLSTSKGKSKSHLKPKKFVGTEISLEVTDQGDDDEDISLASSCKKRKRSSCSSPSKLVKPCPEDQPETNDDIADSKVDGRSIKRRRSSFATSFYSQAPRRKVLRRTAARLSVERSNENEALLAAIFDHVSDVSNDSDFIDAKTPSASGDEPTEKSKSHEKSSTESENNLNEGTPVVTCDAPVVTPNAPVVTSDTPAVTSDTPVETTTNGVEKEPNAISEDFFKLNGIVDISYYDQLDRPKRSRRPVQVQTSVDLEAGRIVYPLEIRADAIKRIDRGDSKLEVARDLDVSVSTVSGWWSKREQILQAVNQTGDTENFPNHEVASNPDPKTGTKSQNKKKKNDDLSQKSDVTQNSSVLTFDQPSTTVNFESSTDEDEFSSNNFSSKEIQMSVNRIIDSDSLINDSTSTFDKNDVDIQNAYTESESDSDEESNAKLGQGLKNKILRTCFATIAERHT